MCESKSFYHSLDGEKIPLSMNGMELMAKLRRATTVYGYRIDDNNPALVEARADIARYMGELEEKVAASQQLDRSNLSIRARVSNLETDVDFLKTQRPSAVIKVPANVTFLAKTFSEEEMEKLREENSFLKQENKHLKQENKHLKQENVKLDEEAKISARLYAYANKRLW